MIERQVDITTPDGVMPTFIYHPTHGGPHPVVLYLMDAPSIRPVLREMANRLSSAGYYVMLPFLYYRRSELREFGMSDEDMHLRQELMGTVTRSNIVGDAEAMLDHAASDSNAAAGPVGTIGFCMSGSLAICVARAVPDRVRAAASIHGGWLVADADDSAHRGLDRLRAEVYMGWCADDPTAPVETLEVMRAALADAGVVHTIDFFTDALHGYAPPGTPRYDRDASELHWERVHSLFRRNLGDRLPGAQPV